MPDQAPADPLLLGIEIGGTKLQLGLGRGDGVLLDLERVRIEPERGAAGILAQIEAGAARLLGRAGLAAGELGAVGIGFGGPVDAAGVAVKSHQVAGWDDFPLADWARRALGAGRVAVENDASTAALGEARHGAGVGFDPVLYVTIGSGVGGGLVVGGRIYRGSGRGAVEIGHLVVGGGRDPAEGRSGGTSLEDRAAGWAIARAGRAALGELEGGGEAAGPLTSLASGRPDLVTGEVVAEAARQGDGRAAAILRDARAALAEGLAHAITLLAPARVVLGGGVSLIGDDLWFDPIRAEVDRRVFAPLRGTFAIVPARLGEEVVVHGALALARDLGV